MTGPVRYCHPDVRNTQPYGVLGEVRVVQCDDEMT